MLGTLRATRILITGGLGFIGSNLAGRCTELDATVTVFDNLAPRSGANPANLQGFAHDIELLVGDIRDTDALGAAMRDQSICFHCAARTSHTQSMTDPFADSEVNGTGVLNVLETARRVNPDLKIVHLATSSQVGAMRGGIIDEDRPERPLDIYSAHKSLSEKYVLIYARAYGLHATAIRLANVYGPRANIRSAEGGFVNYFIGLGLQDLPLTVYGEGGQMRNLVYVDDAVEALLLAAIEPKTDGDVFFAVSGQHQTVAQIAAAIQRTVGGRIRHVEWPRDRQAIEIGDAIISPAKIARILDWAARTSLDEGLRRTREYYLPRLAQYLDRLTTTSRR